MSEAIGKTALLARIDAARAAWESLLAEVGEARMLAPGAMGTWSVKDIVAHVAVYERWLADQLAGGETAGSPPEGAKLVDMDARNAWFYEQDRDRPLAAILAEERAAARDLRAQAAARTDEALAVAMTITDGGMVRPARDGDPFEQPLWAMIAEHTDEHYAAHSPAIRAWLACETG